MTRKTIKDAIGVYELKTTLKPIDEENASAIYLNVFDNGEVENSARWKVNLTFEMKDGTRREFVASILNHFEPARWFDSAKIADEWKEKSFYRDVLVARNELKKAEISFDKKFSAGFFHESVKGTTNKKPNMPQAIAYMFKQEDENPVVGIRFFDFAVHTETFVNPSNRKNAPAYSVCLKSNKKEEEYGADW